MTHRDQSAGALQPGNSISLCFAEPAGLSLELDRIAAPLMDGDDVGHSGACAESLENGRLDAIALATIGNMEGEHARNTTPPQMFEDGTLYVVLADRRLALLQHCFPFGCTLSSL